MSLKINVAGSSSSAAEGPDGMVNLGSDVRVYRTPSGSRQGVMHFTVVDLLSDKYPQCSCEGYAYRGKCKHADYAYKVWLEEIAQAHNDVIQIEVIGEEASVGSLYDQDTEGAFEGLPKD
jgi:hypothetical protein